MTIVIQAPNTYSPDVLNWVCPDVPMAPIELVNNAIRDSVIEFCERSLCWRTELQQILVLGPTSTTTTAAAAQYATSVVVASITNFNDGDTIKVELDNGTWWRGYVSGTPASLTITLDGQLNEAVESGATVTKFVDLYPITLDSGTVVAKGLKAWLNDNVIEPISPDDLDTEFNNTEFGWVGTNWRTDVNLPTRWYFYDDSTVGLALAPNAGGNLRVLVALKPTRASTTFPAVIYQRYIEAIANGAKARIMRIPKKPYTDFKLAAWYKGEFDGAIGDAMISTARGETRAPLRSHTVYGLR